MEMFNFSATEKGLLHKSLQFINQAEVDLGQLPVSTLIVKTENFFEECEQLAPYYSSIGLENNNARLVFNPGKGGGHKILVNQQAITGLSYIHTIVTELVNLVHLACYSIEHGNIYRFSSEQEIGHHYYEFLLWAKFQAMKMGTRAHALLSWHELNGEAPPQDGCYQFSQINFHNEGVNTCLQQLQEAKDIGVWRLKFWDLLEELAFYFGRLAFCQRTARPQELEAAFPAEALERMVGLDSCLAFYAGLQRARNYAGWQEQKKNIRTAIVAMQEHGKRLYEPRV